MSLKPTPLFKEHQDLGAKFAPFAGWSMPIYYTSIIDEHYWSRKSSSLFDISHMGEFIISGKNSKSELNRIATMSLDDIPFGSCRYGFMLNEDGGIVDDLIVYKMKDDKWMMVINAATMEKDEKHIRRYFSEDIRIDNISESIGKLDLQGPLSKKILKELLSPEIESLSYYTFSYFSILGKDYIISRTGYTGELGYELYISKGKIEEIWNTILKDERVKPAGLGARDTLRLEMAYPLYGQDINEDTIPQEAGLSQFVDFNKDFVGKDALLKKKEKGIAKKLVCFIADSRRAPRHNYKIYHDSKEIGIVTSGSFSPTLRCGIGMGYVEDGYKKVGTKLILEDDKVKINATVTEKPFYKEGSVKN